MKLLISTYTKFSPFVVSLSNHPSTSSGRTVSTNNISFMYLYVLLILGFSRVSFAAEALEPDFLDYLVEYSDHQTLFDAADYAFITPNSNIHSKPFQTDEEKSSQQLARPMIKEQKP
ncbi:MAG: hypothetical protein Q7U16_17790 [Agitococcus sp.]|nr:hypothetical protein [Agitococcus sp.]